MRLSPFLAGLLAAGAIAMVAVPLAAKPKPPPTLVVPFQYQGLGVGEGAVQGGIVLTKDSEATYVSRALVAALQDRQYSLVSPKLPVGAVVPQGKTWTSDIVPLSPDMIERHNGAYPSMSLPPRYYSLQYYGEYRLERRELLFSISARLYERAAATEPRPYKKAYSGDFFVAPLAASLKARLMRPDEGQP
ncbi:hypothetical protein BH10PSE4_BH10PSE4_14250 [soil metagenome]